jgi:hypothetical protein
VCVCKCFKDLGLGELGDGECGAARVLRLHDLQFLYCMDRCEMPPPDLPISRVTDYLWVRKGADWHLPADVACHIDQVIQTSEALRLECAQRASKKRRRGQGESKD